MTYKTKGIIIKRSNLGEADRILVIFTEKFGKIKAVAKGVRWTLSKLAGNLELFCLDELLIAEGRNLDIVAGAETIKCYLKLRQDLKATKTAYYFGEIVDKMTEESEPHSEIFDLLENSLENVGKYQSEFLIPFFEINFLSESGFKPELYQCLICGKKSIENQNFFSSEKGGLVCKSCYKSDGIKISNETIKILRLFIKQPISIIKKIKAKDKIIKEVKNISREYLKTISQKEFKSEGFLQ